MSDSRLICIVDDDPAVRDSLSLMLGLKGFDCRSYDSGEAFLSALPARPCCLILDLHMAGLDGLGLQAQLKAQHLPVEIVFLTAFADTHTMRQAFLNEATDFLEKPVVLERLLDALERAFARLQTIHPLTHDAHGFHLLTPREREVLDAIAQGLTHREVGERLGISPRTVEVHKGRVMDKLGTKTLAELLRRAMQQSK